MGVGGAKGAEHGELAAIAGETVRGTTIGCAPALRRAIERAICAFDYSRINVGTVQAVERVEYCETRASQCDLVNKFAAVRFAIGGAIKAAIRSKTERGLWTGPGKVVKHFVTGAILLDFEDRAAARSATEQRCAIKRPVRS